MNKLHMFAVALCCACSVQAQRVERLLEKNWKFINQDIPQATDINFDDARWQSVSVPHDWAIFGPFSRDYDLQNVAVTQNFETQASIKTGRTGGLPYVGIGWYRTKFDVEPFSGNGKRVTLLFDGAMSEAEVYVNGRKACFWPYGYNSFHCDVTDLINSDGTQNTLSVRLENRPQSSRWYPGAGLYRNVHLIVTDEVHVPVWGTFITTPHVEKDYAAVRLETNIENADGKKLSVKTIIRNPEGEIVADVTSPCNLRKGQKLLQNFTVSNPQLWSPESPTLYTAESTVLVDDKQLDTYTTTFGIRSVKVIPNKGFYLNGELRRFKGVCNHHDLGPLGAAINEAALRRQLTMLKDMGCDAIRTAHNMPAPELVKLCDEMGFMMMLEPFDEWDVAKCMNGYHRYFDEWAEKDMVNMLHNYRNNASVVMWSIGNEVPTQCSAEGYRVATFLQDICKREDPTRPVTCGMDQVSCVLNNGFAAAIDVPGFNYRVHRYEEGFAGLPQGFLLGSETSSTVSSRGVYKFPVAKLADAKYSDNQCSSYDIEYCGWSNVPDHDFAAADDYEWSMGQFVWTGFDYLGEPSPYDTDAWPNHSSMFGIIDLASIPKDRYYLYRSLWNTSEHTLHMLPHWTWPGREGEVTPVFVYTDYPQVELFVNGVSQGKRSKVNTADATKASDKVFARSEKDWSLQQRYRLIWDEVVYQPGEIRAVAYDEKGEVAEESVVRTAGKPYTIELVPDRSTITADGKDLCYLTVRIVDKDGNLCPEAGNEISFKVDGAATFRAVANGDPTCLEMFHNPAMHAFNGQLTLIVQSKELSESVSTQKCVIRASGKGLKTNVSNLLVAPL